MEEKRITAAEIAKIAGVSRSTVTGVVNDYSYISDATKAKVREVIAQYGYVPSSAARELVGKMPKIIGHFVYGQANRMHSAYIENMMVDVIEAAQQSSYSVVTSIITEKNSGQVMKLLQNGTVQGAIVAGGSGDADEIETLFNSSFPVIFVNILPADFDLKSYRNKHIVKSDNVKGGMLATEYLISKGHRDIMHITGIMDRLSSIDRLQGYKQALKQHGISFREDRVARGDYTKELADELFTECIRSGDIPSAVFAANDMTAVGVMRACRKNGINIPEDVSLIGFDDMSIASEVQPALTTIKAGSESLALSAVELLLDSLNEGGSEPKIKVLMPELIERKSVKNLL